MKLTIQTLIVACSTLFILEGADASMNPMMVSRNALTKSVRNVSFGNHRISSSINDGSNNLFSPSFDNEYDDGCDDEFDVIEASSTSYGSSEKEVQMCSVSYYVLSSFLFFSFHFIYF